MNESKNIPAFQSMPAVAGHNKVKGFDPTKFIRAAKGGGYALDLKYKKMWFRLAYPEGKVMPVLLQKTDRVAIVEARVYRNVADTEPMASFISTRYANGTEGMHYIEAAQYEAEDQALSEAGFGIQFCDLNAGTAMDQLVANGTVPIGTNIQQPVAAQPAPAVQQPLAAASPVAEPPPAAEQPVAAAPPVAEPPPVAEQPVAAALPVAEPPPVAEQPVAAAPPVAEPPPAAEQPVAAAPPVAEPPPVAEQPVAAALPVAEPPPVAEQPVAAAPPVAEPPPAAELEAPMQHGEAIVFPTAQATVQDDGKYSKDMSVEVICQTMTRAEALTLTVDVGTCKGWTLEKVEATRPASLKWYLNGYNGDDNILRAGAYILLHGEQIQKASA